MFWCHSIAFRRDDSQDFSVYGMGPTTVPLSKDIMTHWAKESSNRWGVYVIAIDRCVVNHVIHVPIMNRQHVDLLG